MRVLVVDVENSVTWREDGTIDGSPFHAANRLVSVGSKWIINGRLQPTIYRFFNHNDLPKAAGAILPFDDLQAELNEADLIVAHNAKHDVMWLEESGFALPAPIYCTMIAEYVLARGLKIPLNLGDTTQRYGGAFKKGDLIEDYWSKRIGFEAMPWAVVQEYGIADLDACADVFLAQLRAYERPENRGLIPTRDMSMELCRVLTDMEKAGMMIDEPALQAVAEEYRAERARLLADLQTQVHAVMGDTPINLNSGEQLSSVIYSRKLLDKHLWAETFNIGTDDRGKPLRRPRMTPAEFAGVVRTQTTTFRKTKAVPCAACNATGAFTRIKKDGNPFAKSQKCKTCFGFKVTYEDLKPGFAGFKLIPLGVEDVAAGGFATDKLTLRRLASQASLNGDLAASSFLQGCMRLGAIESYLGSVVGGIVRGIQADGILHPKFNQCVTSTGRLSSSEPNFQNVPRAKTFPVRRVVKSRFKGGTITEADFSQLEFRVAGELSGCTAIRQVVDDGRDVHKITGSVVFNRPELTVTDDQRTFCKPTTFAPLYGGMGFDEPPAVRAYFEAFTSRLYPGVGAWHKRLADEVCSTRRIRIPSGREYAFPDARRTRNGCTGFTMVKNYPVQGYATGDVVPIAVIRVARALKLRQMRSKLVNTVHDSIKIDTYPGEELAAREVLTWAMLGVVDEVQTRYGVSFRMPLAIEVKAGANWLDMTVQAPIENWKALNAEFACNAITFPLVSFSSATDDPVPDFTALAA